MIAFFYVFLATLGAIIYYAIIGFGLKGLQLSLVGEIYILITLLFIEWVKGKLK